MTHIHITSSLPFFQNRNGYIHRVRYGDIYYYRGEIKHWCFGFWCGGTGFLDGHKKNRLMEHADAPICAICEGKAIGAGLVDASTINGRPVIFQPRKPFVKYKGLPADLPPMPTPS
jgi:hypothetical protein